MLTQRLDEYLEVSRKELNILRGQLAAARSVIAGHELMAADVVGERAANAVLTTEVERLRLSLTWIATVNAMDYEYQAKARAALGEV